MAKKPALLGIAARLGAVVAIGSMLKDPKMASVDARGHAAIDRMRRPDLDAAMPIVTDLGSVYAMSGTAAVLLLGGAKKLAGQVLLAGGLAWLGAQGLKPMYGRTRPYQDGSASKLVRTPAGTSYPSGHPAVAMAMARVLSAQTRWPGSGLISKIPDVVAVSRVYNGVHHPSDVLGGMLLGRAVGDLIRRRALRI